MDKTKWYIRVENRAGDTTGMLGPFDSQSEAWSTVGPHARASSMEGNPVSYTAIAPEQKEKEPLLFHDPIFKKRVKARARTV